jgi:hypothetical protein
MGDNKWICENEEIINVFFFKQKYLLFSKKIITLYTYYNYYGLQNMNFNIIEELLKQTREISRLTCILCLECNGESCEYMNVGNTKYNCCNHRPSQTVCKVFLLFLVL